MRLFNLPKTEDNNKYTKKVQVPQYLPKAVCPKIEELCITSKYTELLKDINTANISDDERRFLKLAATRHIVFNYSKIADYYAHATADMQSLMEKSALVIIDMDDAIANGYVKLSKNIRDILAESGEVAGEE